MSHVHLQGVIGRVESVFNAIDEGRDPKETFYDGYVVNAVMDAAYRSAESRQWEPVDVEWRGKATPRIAKDVRRHDGHAIIKDEILPDGRVKMMLSDKDTGAVFDIVTDA